MPSLLSNARKYITLDQLMIFRIFYESVVIKGQSNAQACESVKIVDNRRDASAVRKVVSGLNKRFEVLFQKPLLQQLEDGTFQQTEIGKELYDFSRRIDDGISDLEKRLAHHLPGAMSMHFWVRSDLVRPRTKWLREVRSELGDQLDIEIHTLQDGNLFEAMKSSSAAVVIDHLFVTDKRNMNSDNLYYYPIEMHPILIGVTPNYTEMLGRVKLNECGTNVLDIGDVADADLLFIRSPFQFRTALALANFAVMPRSFVDSEVIDDVRSYFPNSTIEGEKFSDLAFSPTVEKPHAIFGDAALLRQASEELGQDYVQVQLIAKGVEQYFHEGAIVHRETQTSEPGTGLARLNEIFSGERDEFYRRSKRPDRPEWSATRIRSTEAEYDRSFFRCAGCGERVYYEDETFPIIQECRACLRVQKFDPVADGSGEQVVTFRDVRDIELVELPNEDDPDFSEPIHCEREGCGSILDEEQYHTAKGNPYRLCSTCHTVYQSSSSAPEWTEFECPTPASSCGKTHGVRVSAAKRVAEFYCYNSGRLVKYDADTKQATDIGRLQIKEVTIEDPKTVNSFRCPHLGCGVTARRRLVYNLTGEAYSHCRACDRDIRILSTDRKK